MFNLLLICLILPDQKAEKKQHIRFKKRFMKNLTKDTIKIQNIKNQ